MLTILWRTIRDRWRMLLAMTLIGVLTQLMYISLFPTYQKSFAGSEELFKQMPEALKKAFNMEQFSFDSLEKFLTIEMYSFFWLILTILFTLSLAGSSFAGEVEQETATLTAAQPVSRSTVFWGKFIASAKLFTLFNLLVNGIVLPLAAIFDIAISPSHFLVVGIMGELFGLAVLGLATGVSALLSDKGRVYMVLGGGLLVMYVLNIVAGINASLARLKYASLFSYFNPSTFLVKGHYDLTATLVFTGVLVLGLGVGWWRWTRRDLV